MSIQKLDLGLTSTPAMCCGGAGEGYSCDIPDYAAESTITELDVEGMTCQHCVTSVTEELSALEGVEEVSVALVAGGTSRVVVRGSAPLEAGAARAAVESAGYTLAD